MTFSTPRAGRQAAVNAAAIAPGDLLVVMQMQGAVINFTNSNSNSAGTASCAARTVTAASYAGGNLASNDSTGVWEYCAATTAAGASVGEACCGSTGGTDGTDRGNTAANPIFPGVTTVPTLAVCSAAGQWPNLFTPAGLALPTLPALSGVIFVVGCGVTATGQ